MLGFLWAVTLLSLGLVAALGALQLWRLRESGRPLALAFFCAVAGVSGLLLIATRSGRLIMALLASTTLAVALTSARAKAVCHRSG